MSFDEILKCTGIENKSWEDSEELVLLEKDVKELSKLLSNSLGLLPLNFRPVKPINDASKLEKNSRTYLSHKVEIVL